VVRRAAGSTVVLGFAVLAASPWAARPPEARHGQNPAPPLFRSTTELVEVDAIVQDRDGRFVSGLSADDFEIEEDGKPQRIQLFYLVTGPSASVARAKVPEGLLRGPDQTARRIFTLVFDQDHLAFDAFKRVQDAALAFLQEEFRPGDVGGVVLDGVMARNRLTTLREELVEIVRGARPNAEVRERAEVFRDWPRLESEFEALRIDAGDQRVLAEAVMRNCLERPDECARPGVPESVENTLQWNARRYLDLARAAATRLVQTLSAVVTGLGRLEGRKTVVLLTEGFLVEEIRGMLSQIAARAARFGVTIYAIDARGLARASTGLSEASEPGVRLAPSAFDTQEDGPHILAVETGGFVVRNTNDFQGALARIAEDTSTYYVLGYSPEQTVLDGRFRKIDVRVKWRGMQVRARKGYLATPLPPPMRARPIIR
jgi:VWFA-related protein